MDSPPPDPSSPDPRVSPPGMQVERVTKDDGRALLLYTWDDAAPAASQEPA